jgi:hypothetical protein
MRHVSSGRSSCRGMPSGGGTPMVRRRAEAGVSGSRRDPDKRLCFRAAVVGGRMMRVPRRGGVADGERSRPREPPILAIDASCGCVPHLRQPSACRPYVGRVSTHVHTGPSDHQPLGRSKAKGHGALRRLLGSRLRRAAACATDTALAGSLSEPTPVASGANRPASALAVPGDAAGRIPPRRAGRWLRNA